MKTSSYTVGHLFPRIDWSVTTPLTPLLHVLCISRRGDLDSELSMNITVLFDEVACTALVVEYLRAGDLLGLLITLGYGLSMEPNDNKR